MGRLDGKSAVILGGSSGFGEAIARRSDEARFITGVHLHVDGGGALRRLPRAEDILASIRAAAKGGCL